jgi:hypothetical protein
MTRWNLSVSDQTDKNLRLFLGQQGAKKGALSEFVENAVREKLLHQTAQQIKDRNESLSQGDIMNDITTALEAVRADRD